MGGVVGIGPLPDGHHLDLGAEALEMLDPEGAQRWKTASPSGQDAVGRTATRGR
jgi:hypothetical protein